MGFAFVCLWFLINNSQYSRGLVCKKLATIGLYWGGNDNLVLKRQKQTKCLVEDDIPFSFIVGFGCYNENAKQKLIERGVDEQKIKIIPKAYF